jgi:thiol-activated cytolysin
MVTRPTAVSGRSMIALCLLLAPTGACYTGMSDADDLLDVVEPDHREPIDDGSDDPEPSDEPSGEASAREQINAYIAGLGTPQSPSDDVVEGDVESGQVSGDYMCSTQNMQQTQQFDQIVAFASNSGSMFPGAIVGIDSVHTGLFTPKVFDRAPLTISASLEGVVGGSVSATLEKPSLSTFREAMGEILDQNVVGQTAANVYSQIEEVHSSEQLSFALGVNAQWITAGVESSLAFGNKDKRSRFVVNFTQSYYTVDVDPPGTAADFFDRSVTLNDVQSKLGDEPPVYVSSVTYGRMVYFTITSELSSSELRAALDFGFKGTVSVDGSVSLTHEEVLESSEITAHILGGNGDSAVQAIYGVEELRNFIQTGGAWSKDSPGAAIAYKLAYQHDDSPARYSLTTDYEVQQCERVSQNVRAALQDIHVVSAGGSDSLKLYGDVRVEDANGQLYDLWSRPSDNPVEIGNGMTWPQNGELGSKILPVTPQPGEAIALHLDLWRDGGFWSADQPFGMQVVARPFEDGWRAQIPVPLAAGDRHLEINFDLRPIN